MHFSTCNREKWPTREYVGIWERTNYNKIQVYILYLHIYGSQVVNGFRRSICI